MIDRAQAAKLYDIYQRAFEVLCDAYAVLGSLPDGSERDEAILAHGTSTDAVLNPKTPKPGNILAWS